MAIDIIFIDKIFMVSCLDLYHISNQLSLAFDTSCESFGNKHMVVAGDFGQLPPAGEGSMSLYSNQHPPSVLATTVSGQKNTLGKALWHQFINVVILRENMHQRGMSDEDIYFCKCLENM